jgi:DNA-binding CsgD family transcriptional regulator
MLAPRGQESPPSEMLRAALNALTVGVVLTRHDGQVLYMNAAARRQIRTGRALCLLNNRFSATDPSAARGLRAALACLSEDGENVPRFQTLALPDREGAGVLATILPLDLQAQTPSTAIAAIFIQDPAMKTRPPDKAFAALYCLTDAELRVIRALADGLTSRQVARALGLGLETVKTHLRRIFQKTGATRQADIIALISRAAGPAEAVTPDHPQRA